MDLVALMAEKRRAIEAALSRYLPDESHRLTKAMRYSLFAGGKRLRPILSLLSYEAVGGNNPEEIMPVACSLELVHTFTLIHDDLPSMDDDDFRRGKPSSHKTFGEGMAVLAGDALMIDGMGLMARSTASSRLVKRAISEFARTLGSAGVTMGQADDLYGEGRNPKHLRHIHLRKTALFIAFSVKAGALIGGANEELLNKLYRAGVLAGMGFQVCDDIMDVICSREELGKTPGKDEDSLKLTYPAVYGLERSRRISQSYADRSVEILTSLGPEWERLAALTDYLVRRRR
ncbi:polyprenyl synthetase family protein [candidate division WOR-3 bacterium]|uniref:Polyprenyl synthetase family protein n=1 Tax=candidate division WOR-3 bacterium TaxID=2052148 RepID=A0A9D5KAD4_UNCW3|nr:polyprenyl synthetase family protein [candidate division WOR-3 bacterium]MBD3365258.1 polyprenyl synthetase family protein [candidate division WOR-3 bacterium]